MTKASNLSYYERLPSDALASGEPVSAAHAWLVRNNLLHLRDMFVHHRVSWARLNSLSTPDMVLNSTTLGAYPAPRGIWMAPFVHTWLSPITPTNLDYRFIFGSPNSDGALRFRIVPHFRPGTTTPYPAGDESASEFAFVDETESLSEDTNVDFDGQVMLGTVASMRIAAAIGGFNVNGAFPVSPSGFGLSIQEAGKTREIRMHMLRAELIYESEDDDAQGFVYGAFIREFV